MEGSEKRIQLHIGGMTCLNCQKKIEKALKNAKGIGSVAVSYEDSTAEIVYNKNQISLSEIIAVIEKLGYEVVTDREQQGQRLERAVCVLIIIAALYIILQATGILNLLAPSQLADTKMGYGMLFVIGLITSVHCIAMCGGINLSQCLPQGTTARAGTEGAGWSVFSHPAIAYNLGRVISYTAIGFVLGAVGFLAGGGGQVGMSLLLQGILKMIAGLFMVIMGINMLNLFPWLRKATIRPPRFLARRISRKKAGSRPFVVGLLNGFMPCGPLQSMWIVALATGNPLAGALSMLAFSLGTVPLMLGLGSLVSALGKKFTDQVMNIGAVLVVVLGLAMLSQGGALSGWLSAEWLLVLFIAFGVIGLLFSLPAKRGPLKHVAKMAGLAIAVAAFVSWHYQGSLLPGDTAAAAETDADAAAEVTDGVQVVNSTLVIGRYPDITVQVGVPVRWIIDAPAGSINACNHKMIIQEYGIEYTFQTGENVIEFTPAETGTVRYTCWMGMIQGNIFVVDGETEEAAVSGGQLSSDAITVPVPAGYTIPTDQIVIASQKANENGIAYQTVTVELTEEGFSPAVIVVEKNLATVWEIDNQLEDAAYGSGFLVPYYATELYLGEGTNQLSFYPVESFDASTGDHRFYCYVKVVDDLDAVEEDAIRAEVSAFEPLIYPAEYFEDTGSSCCG